MKTIILTCAIACALQGQDGGVALSARQLAERTPKLSELQIERLKRIDAEMQAISIDAQAKYQAAIAVKQQERTDTLGPVCKAADIPLDDCIPDLKTGAITRRQPPKPIESQPRQPEK